MVGRHSSLFGLCRGSIYNLFLAKHEHRVFLGWHQHQYRGGIEVHERGRVYYMLQHQNMSQFVCGYFFKVISINRAIRYSVVVPHAGASTGRASIDQLAFGLECKGNAVGKILGL